MKIDEEYLNKLLQPLEKQSVLTLTEYLKELVHIGVAIEGERGKIDRKFEVHLNNLCRKRLITNMKGESSLESLGFHLGQNGHLAVIGHIMIMKSDEKEHKDPVNPSTINIGSVTAEQVQIGNNNSQIVNITIHQLATELAKKSDPVAKSLLKQLLENSTVGSVIGAGTSALIGLL